MIYLKLFLTAFFWGGSWVAAKKISPFIDPYAAAFLRFVLGSIFLLSYILKKEGRLPRIKKEHCIPIFLLGMTGIFSYNIFFFQGLKYINAGRASLIVAIIPICIVIFSVLFLKEKLTFVKIVGILLSVFGAVVVLSGGRLAEFFNVPLGTGELLIFGCVVSWTAYTLIGRLVIHEISPLVVVCYASVIGTVFLLVPALVKGLATEIGYLTFENWIYLIYLGFFATMVGFTWFYEGINTVGPTKTAVFINFVPVFSILLSFFILKETVTLSLVGGAVLVLSGVYMTNVSGFIQKRLAANNRHRVLEKELVK